MDFVVFEEKEDGTRMVKVSDHRIGGYLFFISNDGLIDCWEYENYTFMKCLGGKRFDMYSRAWMLA